MKELKYLFVLSVMRKKYEKKKLGMIIGNNGNGNWILSRAQGYNTDI